MGKQRQVTAQIKVQVTGGQATPAPPVGTALGPHGVNIGQFVSQFNEKTRDMMGITIPVVITVYADRSFTFEMKTPPVSFFLKKAAKLEMPALALTDHGAMFGAVEFYLACRKAGIKPIIGCEVYVAPDSHLKKSAASQKESAFHFTLLAEDARQVVRGVDDVDGHLHIDAVGEADVAVAVHHLEAVLREEIHHGYVDGFAPRRGDGDA